MMDDSESKVLWYFLVGTIINGYGRKIQIWVTTISQERIFEVVDTVM